MIIVLLILVIAILLFGSATVLGAVGVLLTTVCIAIVALVFWSAGWLGALVLCSIIVISIVVRLHQSNLQKRDIDERAERDRKLSRDKALAEEKVAHIHEAMDRDRKLKNDYDAAVRRRRDAKN